MSNFCCNDDFNANGAFDTEDKDIFGVFITECLTSSKGCPKTIAEFLAVYEKAVQNKQVPKLTKEVDHLPEFDCADFNENKVFDAEDKDIYDVFVTECITNSKGCPKNVQELLAV